MLEIVMIMSMSPLYRGPELRVSAITRSSTHSPSTSTSRVLWLYPFGPSMHCGPLMPVNSSQEQVSGIVAHLHAQCSEGVGCDSSSFHVWPSRAPQALHVLGSSVLIHWTPLIMSLFA